MLTLSKSETFECLTNYVLKKFSFIDVSKLQPSFNHLPVDPYLKGNYRFRRLSRFQIADGQLIQLPHDCFFQSKDYNPLLGNLKREYAELEDGLIQLPDFQALVLEFFKFCDACQVNEIGVHQIRITASHQHLGSPAPEGIHKDGVDLVAIFCINRHNIAGGETHLYRSKDQEPVFKKILEPGEFLIFNDHQFFHFTSAISSLSFDPGIRDVFVLTAPGLPSPDRT